MKIYFKQGARRLVLAFIGFCVISALFFYFIGGCIFDTYRYIDKSEIVKYENNIKTGSIKLEKFIEVYLEKGYISSYDINCHPYKQYCKYKEQQYSRNKEIEFLKKEKIHLVFESPAPIKYFLWQVWDFIKIFLIAGLLYGIYLLLELTICWIIKGFKD